MKLNALGQSDASLMDTVRIYPEPEIKPTDRSNPSYAFVSSAHNETALDEMKRRSEESLLNPEGHVLRPLQRHDAKDIMQYISTRCRLLLPVYNQERDIGRTLQYLQDIGVPAEHIVASSCSTDDSDRIIQDHGVGVIPQYTFLENALDLERFLELMKADNLKQLRGKGLTMFAGHLQNVLQGKAADPNTFTLQVDTDIQNVGIHANEWDPVTYFSKYLHKHPDIDAIKAAKNGRNNQPMHITINTLGNIHPVGLHYKNSVNMDRWILTGEYGWNSKYTDQLRWATGYAIETVLAMSQTDLGMKRRQVEIPQPRVDGQNLLTKETVMYGDIQATAIEVVRTGKRLHELSLSDIGDINQRRADQSKDEAYAPWVAFEKDENPGPQGMPNRPTPIEFSRLIPDIETLLREKIVLGA